MDNNFYSNNTDDQNDQNFNNENSHLNWSNEPLNTQNEYDFEFQQGEAEAPNQTQGNGLSLNDKLNKKYKIIHITYLVLGLLFSFITSFERFYVGGWLKPIISNFSFSLWIYRSVLTLAIFFIIHLLLEIIKDKQRI